MTPYVTDEKPTPQDAALLAAQGRMPQRFAVIGDFHSREGERHVAAMVDTHAAAERVNVKGRTVYRTTLRGWRVVRPAVV